MTNEQIRELISKHGLEHALFEVESDDIVDPNIAALFASARVHCGAFAEAEANLRAALNLPTPAGDKCIIVNAEPAGDKCIIVNAEAFTNFCRENGITTVIDRYLQEKHKTASVES